MLEGKKTYDIKTSFYVRWCYIQYISTFTGFIDFNKLTKKHPEFKDFKNYQEKYRKNLLPSYKEYISDVSDCVWAISLELSLFLKFSCEKLKPKKIIDLGSGFSSFVIRDHYKNIDEKPLIVTVDDSKEWLEKTHDFLSSKKLSTDNLMTYDEFINQNKNEYDLILHDMGSMSFRANTLKKVIKMANKDSFIILDDVHLPNYNRYVLNTLKKSNHEYYNLKSFTKDNFGRFSMLISY